jgi:DNA-binding GntR family transcriptional regulator
MSAPAARQDAPSLAEAAYLAIRDQLIMLDIAPGSPIKEDVLAAQLGTGRTPIREALKRLEGDHLVLTFPRRGTFATEVNITDLTHISEVRLRLEPLAVESAAVHATDQERQALGELATAVTTGRGTPTELMALDVRVHRALYAATHNPFLQDTLIGYDNLATRIWCLFIDRLPDLGGHLHEHADLLTAVIDGDRSRAAGLAAEHVAHFDRAIRGAL